MGNMSYCRFQSTLGDLDDCYENWSEPLSSDEEVSARRRLLKLCQAIVRDYGDDDE